MGFPPREHSRLVRHSSDGVLFHTRTSCTPAVPRATLELLRCLRVVITGQDSASLLSSWVGSCPGRLYSSFQAFGP